jgi:hypothetical protein
MEISISFIKYYEESVDDFGSFPSEPLNDPEGELQDAYAIILLAPSLYHQIINSANPHLKITTYYGTVIVSPEIEETLPSKSAIMPMSPWMFLITPPLISEDQEKANENDNNDNGNTNSKINETKSHPNKSDDNSDDDFDEVFNDEFDKNVVLFDFETPLAIKATIEATNSKISTYAEILKKFDG